MALTAAQYKSKFQNAHQRSKNGASLDFVNSRPENKAAWAQVASGWVFMWLEKAQMDKHGVTPSAEANAFATDAEAYLVKAEQDAGASTREPQAGAWAMIAHNAAFAWLELTRAETTLPA